MRTIPTACIEVVLLPNQTMAMTMTKTRFMSDATEYVTGETRERRMKASMFWAKWKMPLKKNSMGRYREDDGAGDGVVWVVRERGAEYNGRASVQSQMGKVRAKAKPEQ